MLIGNWPSTWWNTMYQSEIEPRRLGNTLFLKEMYPVHGRTHSANWVMPQDITEHTLLTGNRPRTWQNTLWRPEIDPGHSGTHSAGRKMTGTWQNALCCSEIDPGCGRTHSANWNSILGYLTMPILEIPQPTLPQVSPKCWGITRWILHVKKQVFWGISRIFDKDGF